MSRGQSIMWTGKLAQSWKKRSHERFSQFRQVMNSDHLLKSGEHLLPVVVHSFWGRVCDIQCKFPQPEHKDTEFSWRSLRIYFEGVTFQTLSLSKFCIPGFFSDQQATVDLTDSWSIGPVVQCTAAPKWICRLSYTVIRWCFGGWPVIENFQCFQCLIFATPSYILPHWFSAVVNSQQWT